MRNLKTLKIVALGDSITYGYPYNPEASWTFLVSQKIKLEIINRGINGDTLEGMLERFDEDVKTSYPDILIVMGGTNDAFDDYSLLSMEHNLREIIRRAKALSIRALVGIPIPVDDPVVEKKLSKFRKIIQDFCAEFHIPTIDFYSVMVNEQGVIKNELDFDGVHPNRQGYEVMAKIAEEVLMNILRDL